MFYGTLRLNSTSLSEEVEPIPFISMPNGIAILQS